MLAESPSGLRPLRLHGAQGVRVRKPFALVTKANRETSQPDESAANDRSEGRLSRGLVGSYKSVRFGMPRLRSRPVGGRSVRKPFVSGSIPNQVVNHLTPRERAPESPDSFDLEIGRLASVTFRTVSKQRVREPRGGPEVLRIGVDMRSPDPIWTGACVNHSASLRS